MFNQQSETPKIYWRKKSEHPMLLVEFWLMPDRSDVMEIAVASTGELTLRDAISNLGINDFILEEKNYEHGLRPESGIRTEPVPEDDQEERPLTLRIEDEMEEMLRVANTPDYSRGDGSRNERRAKSGKRR